MIWPFNTKRDCGFDCQTTNNYFLRQELLLKEILMNQDELLVQLNEANALNANMVALIQGLQAAINNANTHNVTPEVEAAINELLDAQKAALPPATEAPAA